MPHKNIGLCIAAAMLAVATGASCKSVSTFKVESIDAADGRFPSRNILSKTYGFGCEGENNSPRLTWTGAPPGTKSFVVTLYDPDAATGVGWTHWVVVNIPASQSSLAGGIGADGAGLVPQALQTRTDFGTPGYGGPCPAKGEPHRYRITVRALDVERLPEAVGPDATPALVGFFAQQHSLGEAVLEIKQAR